MSDVEEATEEVAEETAVVEEAPATEAAPAAAVSEEDEGRQNPCLLYTSPSPRDLSTSRMPSSA